MLNRNAAVDVIVFLLTIAAIGFVVFKMSGDEPSIPKNQRIGFVEVNGKDVIVQDVHWVKIPQAVYDDMKIDPRWAEHLKGNKKRVLLITWDGCPYARAFHKELDSAFGKSNVFGRYYVKDVEVTGQSVSGNCNNMNCPFIWIMNNCMNGICIINPMTKEAIVDSSKNPKQILPLLMAYAKWENDSLDKDGKQNEK